ncbi:hypothetical protein COOONC_01443, partial [Cooperia oncophora]
MSSDLYAECILYNEVLKRNPKSIKEMFSATKIAEIKKFISNNADIPAMKVCAETYLTTRKRPAPSSTSTPVAKKRAVDKGDSSDSDDSSDDETVKKPVVPNGKPMMNGLKRKGKSSSSSSSDSDTAKPTVKKAPV